MAILQKINLGTAPEGKDGDTIRSGNVKVNANVDAIAARVPLEYSYLADSTVLQPIHVGTRFGLAMPGLGKIVTLPLVSSVPVNACVHFFNTGPQTTIGTQGNDGTQIRTLNTGDWATYIADGGSFWHVAARGRMFPDEVTGGNLTVNGSLTVNGRLFAPEGSAKAPGIAFLNDGAPDTGFFHVSDGVFGVSCNTQEVVRYGPGAVSYTVRPTFGGKVPWDNGNFDPASKLNVTGRTDGVAPAAGNVGEIITTSNSTVSLPGNRTPVGTTTLSLSPGEWDVQGSMIFNYNASGTLLTMAFVGVATSSGSITAGQFAGIDGLSTQGWATFVTPMVRFRFSTATTVWLNAQASANAGVPGFGHLTARRVAA